MIHTILVATFALSWLIAIWHFPILMVGVAIINVICTAILIHLFKREEDNHAIQVLDSPPKQASGTAGLAVPSTVSRSGRLYTVGGRDHHENGQPDETDGIGSRKAGSNTKRSA